MLGMAPLGAAQTESPEAPPCQDPLLNQLVHPQGYKTAQLGTLGRTELVGHGPRDVVLIPGFGHGGEVFREFIELNGDRYRMLVVTPAGMGGTPAPPMPEPSESYGKRAWSSAFEKAVWDSIQRHRFKKPALFAFAGGLQHAFRIALEHPDAVGPIVSIAGEPVREFDERTTFENRAWVMDNILAKTWFKTVTPKTWREGMGTPGWYSSNSKIGTRLYEASLVPPIPTMVRYLCERWSYDVRPELSTLGSPVLALLPDANAAPPDDDGYKSFLDRALVGPWQSVAERCRCQTVTLEGARMGMLADHTERVSREIERFLAKN